MKKVIAGLVLSMATLFVALGFSAPAQAYPDTPPTGTNVTPPGSEAAAAPSSSTLPNTGGPNAALLGGGLVLVVAGAVVVLSARPRQRATD